jgi:hypothetical protein
VGVSIIVGNHWLREHTTPSTIRWSTKAIGGCHEAAFEIDPTVTPPGIDRGAAVQYRLGMTNVWRGVVDSINDQGTVTCIGPWSAASQVSALDSGGAGSLVPNTAVNEARSRGAIAWRMPAAGISAAAVSDGTDGEPMLLNELLEAWAVKAGAIVGVDANLDIYAGPASPAASWVVSPHAGARLTVVGDYVSHLWGDYIDTTGAWAKAGPVIDQVVADAWGRREATANLEELGPINSTTATTVLTSMLVNGAARKSVTGTLRLSREQILTPGGEPAPLTMIRGGQRARLLGVGDGTNAAMRTLYTDIVIDQCSFTEGEDEISFDPMGGPAVNLGDILTARAS